MCNSKVIWFLIVQIRVIKTVGTQKIRSQPYFSKSFNLIILSESLTNSL